MSVKHDMHANTVINCNKNTNISDQWPWPVSLDQSNIYYN